MSRMYYGFNNGLENSYVDSKGVRIGAVLVFSNIVERDKWALGLGFTSKREVWSSHEVRRWILQVIKRNGWEVAKPSTLTTRALVNLYCEYFPEFDMR